MSDIIEQGSERKVPGSDVAAPSDRPPLTRDGGAGGEQGKGESSSERGGGRSLEQAADPSSRAERPELDPKNTGAPGEAGRPGQPPAEARTAAEPRAEYLARPSAQEQAERQEVAKPTSGIGFEYGKSTLSDEGRRQVADMLPGLKEQVAKGGTVFLEGHASRPGGEDFNYELSRQRAETVKGELVRQGIDGDKVKTSWQGEGAAKVRGAPDDKDDRNDRVVGVSVVQPDRPPIPTDQDKERLPKDLAKNVGDQFTRDKQYDPSKEGPELIKNVAKDLVKPSIANVAKEGAVYVFKWGTDTVQTTEAFKRINHELVPAAVNRIGELTAHGRLVPGGDGDTAYTAAGRTAAENAYLKLPDADRQKLVGALRDPAVVDQLKYQIYDAMKNKLEGRTR